MRPAPETSPDPGPITAAAVAVLSDVHGNDLALAAVLAELATVPHDAVVVAGDHLWNGVRPAEVMARLRGLGAPLLLGNTDEYLWLEARHPDMPAVVAWTVARIGPDALATMRAMPVAQRFTPPGGHSPDHDLLVVHATPTDVDAELVVEPDPFGNLPVTPEPEARRLIGGAVADLIVAGHLHYASAGTVGDQRLASVGSVGAPLDGDPRAAWGVAHWDGRHWRLEPRRTPYDVEAAAAEVARLHPAAAHRRVLADRLRRARWLPFD